MPKKAHTDARHRLGAKGTYNGTRKYTQHITSQKKRKEKEKVKNEFFSFLFAEQLTAHAMNYNFTSHSMRQYTGPTRHLIQS